MKILSILFCISTLTGCATTASEWTEPITIDYVDEKGVKQKKVVNKHCMKIQGSGKADFEKKTIDGKVELIPKELISINGSKVVNE